MNVSASLDRDANRQIVSSNEAFRLESVWTFVVTTTGLDSAHTLFTVTGKVAMAIFAVCDTTLDSDGAPTIELGVANNTASIIAQSVAKSLAAGEVWVDATMTRVGVGDIPAMKVNNGKDVILTIGSTTLKAGKVSFYCLWRPLSSDGLVTVTTPA